MDKIQLQDCYTVISKTDLLNRRYDATQLIALTNLVKHENMVIMTMKQFKKAINEAKAEAVKNLITRQNQYNEEN